MQQLRTLQASTVSKSLFLERNSAKFAVLGREGRR
jgi:hypothetical protein